MKARIRGWGLNAAVAVLALYVLAPPALTQSAMQLFGTFGGVAKAVAVDTNGAMQVIMSGLAGSGTSTFKIGGTVFWSDTDTANAADTNWVLSDVYALPAATLITNGDRLDIETTITFSAAVSTKSYDCRIAYTSFAAVGGFTGGVAIYTNNTATASDSFVFPMAVTRQGATTASAYSYAVDENGALIKSGGVYQSGAAVTWANANNVACAVKDGTGNAAAATIRELRVDYVPYR